MTGGATIHKTEYLEQFENTCRVRKLKITQQRLEVFNELTRFPGHPTAEDIYLQVRRRLKTISLDTVYRTIGTFEKYGLVKRIQLIDNKARYDINLNQHHHLVCTRCHNIEDFYWPDFDRIALPRPAGRWGTVNSKHVEIHGLCRKCRGKTRK